MCIVLFQLSTHPLGAPKQLWPSPGKCPSPPGVSRKAIHDTVVVAGTAPCGFIANVPVGDVIYTHCWIIQLCFSLRPDAILRTGTCVIANMLPSLLLGSSPFWLRTDSPRAKITIDSENRVGHHLDVKQTVSIVLQRHDGLQRHKIRQQSGVKESIDRHSAIFLQMNIVIHMFIYVAAELRWSNLCTCR